MKLWVSLLATALFLFAVFESARGLSRDPLRIFLLEESETEMDAFSVELYLSGARGTSEPITLTGAQSQALREAFDQKQIGAIQETARALGAGAWVVAVPGPMENWPWFIGGGLSRPWGSGGFDNLTWADKLYLSLATKAPLGLPLAGVPPPSTGSS
ncbi:MAG TPA: hypothetical protein VMU88_01145, partial [bacterium]|nr:hypothetical protein [bacterium]